MSGRGRIRSSSRQHRLRVISYDGLPDRIRAVLLTRIDHPIALEIIMSIASKRHLRHFLRVNDEHCSRRDRTRDLAKRCVRLVAGSDDEIAIIDTIVGASTVNVAGPPQIPPDDIAVPVAAGGLVEQGGNQQELMGRLPGASDAQFSMMCFLCLDAESEYVITPCGHSGCCDNCRSQIVIASAPYLPACPICRHANVTFLKIFYP